MSNEKAHNHYVDTTTIGLGANKSLRHEPTIAITIVLHHPSLCCMLKG